MGAVEVSTWTGLELEAVVAEAKRYARSLAKTDVERANQILLRGAALHGDIARLIPEDTVRKSPTQRTAYIVRDGRWLGIRYISVHWQLGRSLLDGITPDPATNPGVKAWYREIAAHLLQMRQFAAAVDHFARARQMFPSDPDILFASGVLHERFGSTALQAAAESVTESKREASSVNSARGELVPAERFYREALAHRPDHLEARVRHGRVLDDLERHDEASKELRARSPTAPVAGFSTSRNYSSDARRKRVAITLRPALPSCALRRCIRMRNRLDSRSARLRAARADRAAAQRELQFLADLPDDERRREDPWWLYYDVR